MKLLRCGFHINLKMHSSMTTFPWKRFANFEMHFFVCLLYYRPQTKFAKIMFLHLSVSHSVYGGGRCLPQCMLRYTAPKADTSLGADTPQEQTPSGADTLWSRPLPGADTLLSRHPPKQTPPLSRHPPVQCMLGDTGNKRAVRILLECILVWVWLC